MRYQVAVITVTQSDIDRGMDTAMQNPVARALARDLSLEQGVFLATDGCSAFEMQAPYRTINLSSHVTQWIKRYCDGDKMEPLAFQIVLDQQERLPHDQGRRTETHQQESYAPSGASQNMPVSRKPLPGWQAPSPN